MKKTKEDLKPNNENEKVKLSVPWIEGTAILSPYKKHLGARMLLEQFSKIPSLPFAPLTGQFWKLLLRSKGLG